MMFFEKSPGVVLSGRIVPVYSRNRPEKGYFSSDFAELEYFPYGEVWVNERVSEDKNYDLPYQYTAKEYDPETKLHYYGARYYDARLSLWISPDPIMDGLTSGRSIYAYCYNNPVIFIDPNGLWVDNGDGTFVAEKGDTLNGLTQETGKDWRNSDFSGDPRKMPIGQTVDMGKKDQFSGNATVIHNEGEAEDYYKNGSGAPVKLGDNVLAAVRNSKTQQDKEKNRIRSGATTEAVGNYGVDLVGDTPFHWAFGKNNVRNKDGLFFLGDTRVDYHIYSGTKTTIVDFTAFGQDGFWDIPGAKGVADGPYMSV